MDGAQRSASECLPHVLDIQLDGVVERSTWKLEVEFSSQPGFKYDFTSKDFGEEGAIYEYEE